MGRGNDITHTHTHTSMSRHSGFCCWHYCGGGAVCKVNREQDRGHFGWFGNKTLNKTLKRKSQSYDALSAEAVEQEVVFPFHEQPCRGRNDLLKDFSSSIGKPHSNGPPSCRVRVLAVPSRTYPPPLPTPPPFLHPCFLPSLSSLRPLH